MYSRSSKNHIESGKLPENIYVVSSKELNDILVEANKAFKGFKTYQQNKKKSQDPRQKKDLQTQEIKAISRAISLYEKAIELSKTKSDLAYCQRKYASTIIRNEGLEEKLRYEKAQKALDACITNYQQALRLNKSNPLELQLANNNIIIAEMQRAYCALAQAALTLRDGICLENAITELFPLLSDFQTNAYYRDALTFQYHLNLSQNKLEEAKNCITQLMQLNIQNNQANHTNYRHLAKINLLLAQDKNAAYFNSEVLHYFWQSFDEHKHFETRAEFHEKKFALIADFCMLLHIKTVEQLYKINETPKESIYAYMQRQIAKVFLKHNSRYRYILSHVDRVIEEYQAMQKINLSFQLFAHIEPASISINAQQFSILFADYLANKNNTPVEMAKISTQSPVESSKKIVQPKDKPQRRNKLNPNAKPFIPSLFFIPHPRELASHIENNRHQKPK